MMHGKSVCHVDVPILLHHLIHRCFVARDSMHFSGAGECVGLVVSVSGLSYLKTQSIILLLCIRTYEFYHCKYPGGNLYTAVAVQ